MQPPRVAGIADDARDVVGEGGTQIAAGLDDLGLAEGRMQRIGRAEKLHQPARGDAAGLLVLDHRRADHEEMIRARHDVDRMARMDEPHGARQGDLRAAQHDHFAFHAAQVGQAVACGEPACVDDPVGVIAFDLIDAEPDRHIVHVRQHAVQRRERMARFEMRFRAEKQRRGEPAAEIRLQRLDRSGIEQAMMGRLAREAAQVRRIARRREHEAAGPRRHGHGLRPEGERFDTEIADHRIGAFRLAPGREHAAGKEGTAEPGTLPPLDDIHRRAALRAGERGGEPGDARAEHGYAGRCR